MFHKNNYIYKLMEKENKRLIWENERLKNQLEEVERLKKEYQNMIDSLHACKKKYLDTLARLETMESSMRREMENILDLHKN